MLNTAHVEAGRRCRTCLQAPSLLCAKCDGYRGKGGGVGVGGGYSRHIAGNCWLNPTEDLNLVNFDFEWCNASRCICMPFRAMPCPVFTARGASINSILLLEFGRGRGGR